MPAEQTLLKTCYITTKYYPLVKHESGKDKIKKLDALLTVHKP